MRLMDFTASAAAPILPTMSGDFTDKAHIRPPDILTNIIVTIL
jgi:hypothetical protein